MATAHRRGLPGGVPPQAVPHATLGEDLTEAAALDIESRRAQLKESVSMVHRTLGRYQHLAGVHEPQPWRQQITVRSVVLGAVFGAVFSIIVHKLNLTSGVIPSLGMAMALINFFTVNSWNAMLRALRVPTLPFTPQENAIMQTCVGSVAGMAFTGGFGSYLIAMDQQSYQNLGSIRGNLPSDVYNPELARTIPYLLLISLIGIFVLLGLRKRFVVDYALPYPSSMASGVLINSLHSIGNSTAARQMRTLCTWGFSSFGFSFFKWFFSATGAACGGFDGFPTLGLQALRWTWSFDWSLTYIGVGMICPHIVNASMLLGSVITWGFLWPYIAGKAGAWFPAGLNEHDFSGLFGYKVFIAMSVFLGDGLYNFTKIAIISILAVRQSGIRRDTVRRRRTSSCQEAAAAAGGPPCYTSCQQEAAGCSAMAPGTEMAALPKEAPSKGCSEAEELPATPVSPSCEAKLLTELRNEVFLHEAVPWWVGAVGYVLLGILGAGAIPLLYPAVRWYMVAVAFLSAPVFSVCNAYGAGLTDWDMSSLYGKLCIFAFAAWGGGHGGVTAGLAICGVMLSVTSAAAGLLGDFKTAWVTLSSARSMFVAQVIGSIMGCVIAPLTFLLFYKAFDIGVPGSAYPAPYATIYRAMAILGVEGLSALPANCLKLCGGFFLGAMAISAMRDILPKRYARCVPIPMAAAIPFYIGAQLAVDMCIGSLVKLVWERKRPEEADAFVPVAASGLIAGDGLWSVPAAVLAMAKLNPPICMSFSPAP